MGYLSLSTVFSCFFFSFQTIFSAVLVLLLILLWPQRRNLMLDIKVPYFGTQALVFSFLFFFRLSFMADWENESWKAMFKDDYFYAANLSAIFHTQTESRLNEITLMNLGLGNIYQIYHFFTFSIGIFLKLITQAQSYFIFNFFIIPFFQLFAFCGLFSAGLFLKASPFRASLIAMFVLSSLRYSLIDDFIFHIFKINIFSRSVIFQNYFGNQLLNSGFGLKFCIAIGLISMFFININNIRVLSNSFFLIFINPLYLLISGYIFIFSSIFNLKNLKILFINFLVIASSFFLFLKIQNQRNQNPDYEEFTRQVFLVFESGVKKIFFNTLGETFNTYYFIWILPIIFIIIIEKRLIYRIISFLFIIFPLYEISDKNNILSKIYLISIITFSLILISNNIKKKIFIFLYVITFSCFFLTAFSHVYIDFNQFFMFINFTFPFLLSCFLLIKYSNNSIKFTSIFIILIPINIFLNFKESQIRSVNLSEKSENDTINNFIEKESRNKLDYIGIIDYNMTFQFNNQFWEGEEWFIRNDKWIPTPASSPKFGKGYRKNSEYLKDLFPVCKFSELYKPKDTSAAFIQKYQLPILIVKTKDLGAAASAISLYSKSMVNSRLDYTVFYDLKPEFKKESGH